ncbi:hypothetical protein CsatA_016119 [Cannabis sativa]
METSPPPQLTLRLIFSETKRVLIAQPRHFLTLSLIFLIPLSIAAAIFPIYFESLFTLFRFSVQPSVTFPTKTLLFVLAYTLFISLFSTSAIGTITNSVIETFHGQTRINLQSATKSLSTSFFRLLVTNNYAGKIVVLITFGSSFVLSLLILGAVLYGYNIDFSSPKFLLLFLAFSIVQLSVAIFLHVNWTLSSVVVVAEKISGLASLKRSWSLVKGRRLLVLNMSMCSGLPLATLWLVNFRLNWPSLELAEDEDGSDKLIILFSLTLQVLLFSTIQTSILLIALTANTVLYLYCNKAGVVLHGDKEFSGNYISLKVYDEEEGGKVSSVMSKLDN